MTTNGPLDNSIYNDLISAYVIKNIKIKKIDEKVLDKENPRRLIGQNRQFVGKLIEMMAVK